jgi:hypothetical protein
LLLLEADAEKAREKAAAWEHVDLKMAIFPVSASFVTISNIDLLSSSKTGASIVG